MRGTKLSKERKEAISKKMLGPKNHRWISDRSKVGRVGQNFSKKQRNILLDFKRAFCGATDNLELDHIVPIFAGGTNADSNAQTLCRKCNSNKRTTDLHHYNKSGEFGKTPNPNWVGNTEPSADGNICVGVTDRGRVLRRKGTRFLRHEIVCPECGIKFLVQANRMKSYIGHKVKRNFCSMSCKSKFYRKDSNFLHEPPTPSNGDDIS